MEELIDKIRLILMDMDGGESDYDYYTKEANRIISLMTSQAPSSVSSSAGLEGLQLKAKTFIDANVWDGEDRSGATNDRATFNPDELQELIDDLMEYLAD